MPPTLTSPSVIEPVEIRSPSVIELVEIGGLDGLDQRFVVR